MSRKLFLSVVTRSPEETKAVAGKTVEFLKAGDLILLIGDLGSGKTRFVSGLVERLSPEKGVRVASPTFVILHRYQARFQVNHLDIYRLKTLEELLDTGFEEFLTGNTLTLVEWADKFDLAERYPGAIVARFYHRGGDEREIQVELPEDRFQK